MQFTTYITDRRLISFIYLGFLKHKKEKTISPINKVDKSHEQRDHEKDIQVVSKHMERTSASFRKRNIQIQTIQMLFFYILTLTKMA